MKKILSIVLTICMAFSVLTVGAASVSAAEDTVPAGTVIYFDNSSTKWDNVYFYAWQFGFFGDTYEMTPVKGHADLYKMVLPVETPVGEPFFLFKSAEDWSGKQTVDQAAYVDLNTYVPRADASGNVITVDMKNTVLPAETEVLVTPSSKEFTSTLNVAVYAFNVPEGSTATYTVNGTSETFTTSASFTIYSSATVTVTANGKSQTQTYTKKNNAVVNVSVEGGYTDPIYMYTFGGDRVGTQFVLMTRNADGKYTAEINGSAQVIFTTTNNWDTAQKFIIMEGLEPAEDQEPLVSAGTTRNFTLTLPVTPTTPAE